MAFAALYATIVATLWIIPYVASHGRLLEPPSRASMWRQGYNTPKNWNDNQLYCGGRGKQWGVNGGKCGICGDPWDGTREHEAGGKFATGTITRTYQEGSSIHIKVELTAHHKGWFEMRICPNNDVNKPATHECLNRYLLAQSSGNTRYDATLKKPSGIYEFDVALPDGLTCTQCVLQWRYHTGNSWGTDPDTGKGCLGCGPEQEEFYHCSDVAITPTTHTGKPDSTQPPETTPQPSTAANEPASSAPADPSPTGAPACTAATGWEMVAGIAAWCQQDCDHNCHHTMCKCAGDPARQCVAVAPYNKSAGMVTWCYQQCPGPNCLSTHCSCQQEINGLWVPLR